MTKQSGSERVALRARRLLPMAFALAGVFAAAPAGAEPTFPGTLADKVGATCIVTCLTCHTDPAGGLDKLKPFGAGFGGAVKAVELTGNLAALDSYKTSDADGDKVSDLDEVKAGHDPTAPGSTSICTPSYGCGARLAHTPPSGERGAVGALVVAAAALVLASRRRSKPPSV